MSLIVLSAKVKLLDEVEEYDIDQAFDVNQDANDLWWWMMAWMMIVLELTL